MGTGSVHRGEQDRRGGEITAALISEMKPLLHAYCRRFLADHSPADDAVQQTFEIAPGPGRISGEVVPVSRFNAPLAVAAAIVLVLLTIAVQGNLQGGPPSAPEFPERAANTSPWMEGR